MNKHFDNYTVLITGAASGLGKELSVCFYKMGCNLALADTNFSALHVLAETFTGTNRLISIHEADVSDPQAIQSVVDVVLLKHKQLDILINNAAISASVSFENVSVQNFKKVMEVNLMGVVHTTKCCLPYLHKSKDGYIVNIASGFAGMGFPGKSAYAASKAALIALTNVLQTELAGTTVKPSYVIPPPMVTGIIVNNLHESFEKMQREQQFIRKHATNTRQVAELIIRGMERKKFRNVIGFRTRWVDLCSRLFPSTVQQLIGKRRSKIDFY
ncbi:MAG: SDR family NAD(P)-dependent oxidoreductase [Bacteroidetes bacterium]|nr:SDR family NAD(P)-dependent oxidoreductase [Bacteroidota bacterium]